MSEARAAALLPKLRFPEFREAGAWQLRPMNQLAKRCTLKNRDEKVTRVLTNSAELGVVDQRDYFDRDIAAQGKLEGYFLVKLGDYVYNPRTSVTAPVGPISKNAIGLGVMSPLYTVFRFNHPDNDFYRQFFKTTIWHTYLRQASSTGARHDRMSIGSDDFMAMPLPVTAAREQQKIADCLSSLDDLIAAQARKVEALRSQKDSLLQRVFPRGGADRPRLRFKEFENAGTWSEVKAGLLFENRIAKGVPDLPIFSVTMNDGMVTRQSLDRKVDDIQNASSNKKVLQGDLVYNMMRMWQGAVGVAPQDCLVSPAYIVLSPKAGAVPHFFQYLFKLPEVLQLLKSHSRGLTEDRLRLYFDDFARITLRCPGPIEQRRIAELLRAVDGNIAAQSVELAALKAHRTGLMQQLFPSLEAAAA